MLPQICAPARRCPGPAWTVFLGSSCGLGPTHPQRPTDSSAEPKSPRVGSMGIPWQDAPRQSTPLLPSWVLHPPAATPSWRKSVLEAWLQGPSEGRERQKGRLRPTGPNTCNTGRAHPQPPPTSGLTGTFWEHQTCDLRSGWLSQNSAPTTAALQGKWRNAAVKGYQTDTAPRQLPRRSRRSHPS